MQIDGGRIQAGVPKQFLDLENGDAIFQKVCRETMS
jgi:hypothetical protein